MMVWIGDYKNIKQTWKQNNIRTKKTPEPT